MIRLKKCILQMVAVGLFALIGLVCLFERLSIDNLSLMKKKSFTNNNYVKFQKNF